MTNAPKLRDVLQKIRVKAQRGEFIILPHAVTRRIERDIAVADITHVLINGVREEAKDQYRPEFIAWNYAIRGKTIDNRDLRIIVSFDENNMLVITVIRLKKGR